MAFVCNNSCIFNFFLMIFVPKLDYSKTVWIKLNRKGIIIVKQGIFHKLRIHHEIVQLHVALCMRLIKLTFPHETCFLCRGLTAPLAMYVHWLWIFMMKIFNSTIFQEGIPVGEINMYELLYPSNRFAPGKVFSYFIGHWLCLRLQDGFVCEQSIFAHRSDYIH